MANRHDAGLERRISNQFRRIEDSGWFPVEVAGGSGQLALVREILRPSAGMRILDAGCARGRFLRHLVPAGAQLFGVDLTEVFLHSAHRNVPEAAFAVGSLSALPFAAASFDAILSIEVLEHLPNTDLAVCEMARVLKPGGTLLIIDKNMLGLNPRNGVPNAIWKRWVERRNGWMYPADFPFRERWFWPGRLARLMERYFESVSVRFSTEGFGRASRLYRALTFLSFEAAWVGRRPIQNGPSRW